jgi:hypothetical protein
VVQAVLLHVAESVPVNPVAQTGVHVVPSADPTTQFPAKAFGMAGRELHKFAMHVPVTVHAPFEHEAERVPEYPELQTGVHVVPVRTFVEQSPTSPFWTNTAV